MRIENMFQEDINRKINGVVKVDQDANDVLVQELNEYVITKELKKHFITFFNNYGDSFNERTSDIGVWISGFFGSGKSHFLKMLSYLLENREVQGERTVERFRKKFADDPATFMLIDNATKGHTDTILFNIDIEGSINKDKTAVLRVFAKMFYNYLGFYGENLKVAKLEQFIERQGKTEEFRRVFEKKNGESWLNSRDAFAFFEDDVVETLQDVLGMSESAAQNWFNGTEEVETSIAQLVSEIKEYVNAQPEDFRLLFMIDEVGQYVGGDTDLLINLQSLVEKIGSECEGKVWVVCTGQEAIDEIIKARENEFSRIQARFKTRLSLSSASADEVIQKRILLKKDEAKQELEEVYKKNDSVLRNLFSFSEAIKDIKGYSGSTEFVRNFPFVPYQFILMQKVFAEIRKHGNSGKHLSGGERSMLSGFQEAAQKIEAKDEYALAPFHLFYDTVHTFLDSSIRRVIERCERAAESGSGLEPQDVDVLKLLYLIRYVDDVKANIDNIVILMADDIRMDKINMREQVRASLERLLSQNYIGRTGEVYNFLTDEEQDIQRDIYRNTEVATAEIVSRIGSMIFGDIYTTKKAKYGQYNFPFDQKVDNTGIGASNGGMLLQILTVATDKVEKTALRLTTDSVGKAVVVLADTSYYESLENAMKIRKYVKQRNVAQLAKSVQDIIRGHQDEATKYEQEAREELKKAIEEAEFYVAGEHIEIKNGSAEQKLSQALEYLVAHVYSELNLIGKNADTEADIAAVLKGQDNFLIGEDPNGGAAAKIEEYLEMQANRKLPTTMADVQSKYQAVPFGWQEIDIAYVVARLICDQKVTIKYGGATIQPTNPKLIDMLRKKSETGKTSIAKRMVVSAQKIRTVRELLRDYFDEMDVPEDEDGLVLHIVEKFSQEKAHYESLLSRYGSHKYPDKLKVANAVETMNDILAQQKDNQALIEYVIKKEDTIFDLKEKMQKVEAFFKNQAALFDEAVKYEKDLWADREHIEKDEEAKQALDTIRLITLIPASGSFNYSRIPELNGLLAAVRTKHGAMLEQKRQEISANADECLKEIHDEYEDYPQARGIFLEAENYFKDKKERLADIKVLTMLDGQIPTMWMKKDDYLNRIEELRKKEEASQMVRETPATPEPPVKKPKKKVKPISRWQMFPKRTIETDEDIDEYVENIRKRMKTMLKDCDGIQLD
ncbi:BREX system P-loop protein BrxC [Selenomonas sp. FC4001]|uniref:BREX system P-loop protein BrxC n=1 Tax=Selenomonas sp. FC4001 TaxID=1408313 RepID=UPI000566392F|nr:BREX system P-loop protein BrxC [Selenomonas sp. FC4001]